MRTIHKYPLDKETIMLPAGSIVRHIDVQNSEPFAWVEVNTEIQDMQATLFVFTTGSPLPERQIAFVKTLLCYNETIVIHIFKKIGS